MSRLSISRRGFPFALAGLSAQLRGWQTDSFHAGAAKRVITPDPLLPISGGMGNPAPAKAKQGDLTARVLAVRAGSEEVVLAGLDLLGFPGVLCDRFGRWCRA